MTRNSILSLALMGALAVPALAQNQPAPSSQPQATQSTSQDTQTNAQGTSSTTATATTTETATGKEPLTNSKKEGFWGHLNPFARKKYVQRQLDPVRGRV